MNRKEIESFIFNRYSGDILTIIRDYLEDSGDYDVEKWAENEDFMEWCGKHYRDYER